MGAGGTLGEGGASSLECDESSAGMLPSGEAFGEGDREETSPFAEGSYSLSQGPGVAVIARDAFRLYVNGTLLHESEGARNPVFVPIVFPPGENIVALAVAADSGTPAVVVQVDELSRTVVSDGSWRYSSTPEGDWQAPGFDDDNWNTVTELAEYGEAPGCDPEGDFPMSASARWIGPPLSTTDPLALRTRIDIAPIGFAEGTTGGAGAAPESPGEWADLQAATAHDEAKVIVFAEGDHDYRRTGSEITDQGVCPAECPNDASKTTYQVLLEGETCAQALTTVPRNDRILRLGSNTTLMGLGRGASLRGVTLDFQESENIIVRNIALYDVNPGIIEAGDAFSLNQPSRVWIDHGTAKWISDGLMDLRAGSTGVTLSHMRYDGRSDFDCEGSHPRTSLITDSEVTIHHSRFDHVRNNAPVVIGSEARVHLLNNSYSNVSGWAIGSGCQAVVLVEGSTFENVDAIALARDCDTATELGYLDFPTGSNLYRDGSPAFLGGDGTEPQDGGFTPPYPYETQPAAEAWPLVVSRAGTGGPWALPLSLD